MSETPIATVAHRRAVAWWLLAVATMILVMVMLGGLTRLTHSGLSMVEWRPVTGWLPPLNDAAWEDAFRKYKQYPEYRALNYGMSLDGFRSIYWLEYVHRVWGRLIAIGFAAPCIFFLARRWVDRSTGARLVVLFVLGALQGGLGWLMVQSGLVDRPDVSHYRLTAHLGLALALFGYTVWLFLETVRPASRNPPGREEPGFRRSAGLLAALAFVTALSGGLVAGLDAGFVFNTFPLMDGRLVPDDLLEMRPIYLNLFENLAAVQFDHRCWARSSHSVRSSCFGGCASRRRRRAPGWRRASLRRRRRFRPRWGYRPWYSPFRWRSGSCIRRARPFCSRRRYGRFGSCERSRRPRRTGAPPDRARERVTTAGARSAVDVLENRICEESDDQRTVPPSHAKRF